MTENQISKDNTKGNVLFSSVFENNDILREFTNVKSRNQTNSFSFNTIIFKKFKNEKEEREKTNENDKRNFQTFDKPNVSILNENDMKLVKTTTEYFIKQDNKIKIKKVTFTPLKNKNMCKEQEKFQNLKLNKITSKQLDDKSKLNVDLNVFYKNKLNIADKKSPLLTIINNENKSVKNVPINHKKSISLGIEEMKSLYKCQNCEIRNKLPFLHKQIKPSLNLNFMTQLQINLRDLKKQMYNKYFSTSKSIDENRISAERKKSKLKINVLNKSNKSNNPTYIKKRKFLPTHIFNSLAQKEYIIAVRNKLKIKNN